MENLDVEIFPSVETIYRNDDIFLIDTLKYIQGKTVKIENGWIIGFCLKGAGSFKLDNKIYHMFPDDMGICFPNVVISPNGLTSDFEWRVIVISSRMIDMICAFTTSESWSLIQAIEKNPVWHLNSQKIKMFLLYYDLLKIYLNFHGVYHYGKERLLALLHALSYDLFQTLVNISPDLQCNNKPEHYLFPEFLKILSESYPCNRKVSYYADLLNTTPKYLTYVCKQQCGKTASEIINQHMVKDIIRLLQDSKKNIKEISNELDFPSLSFFGTYVKHHLKMSPKAYRNKQFQEEKRNKKR